MNPPPNRPAGNSGNRPASGRPGTGRTGKPGTGSQANSAARTGAGDAAGGDPNAGKRGMIGVGLIVLGVTLGIVGVWIAWAGWVRWDGIEDLKTAWSMQLNDQEATRKQYAHRAAEELPTTAAAVLMDIDFTSDTANARLEELMNKADPRDRGVIYTAQALAGALKGQSPSQDVGAGDGEMLSILAALVRGEPPHLLPSTLKGESHQSVQYITFAKQFQAALKAGDAGMIKQAAGMVSLAMPNHPQSAVINLIATICDDAKPRKIDLDAAVDACRDRNLTYSVLMALIPAFPARAVELTTMAYGGRLTNGAPPLEAQVSEGVNTPVADLYDLAQRCIAAGRVDLVPQLVPKLSPADAAAVTKLLNISGGDLRKLLETKSPELRPRIATMAGRHHGLAFQLSNDAGVIPSSKVTVTIGSEEVDKGRITQNGTLFSVAPANPPQSGQFEVEVHAGEAVIWHGTVTL